jgi:hypothetical protein
LPGLRAEVNLLQGVGDLRGAPRLAGLFRMLFQRGRASRALVASEMDWDAEIILRAFYETMAKILRICVAPEDGKAKLLDEYWNESAEIHNRRKKGRAAWVQKQSQPFDEVATAIFSLVQDDRVTPISSEPAFASWSITLSIFGQMPDRAESSPLMSFSILRDKFFV